MYTITSVQHTMAKKVSELPIALQGYLNVTDLFLIHCDNSIDLRNSTKLSVSVLDGAFLWTLKNMISLISL